MIKKLLIIAVTAGIFQYTLYAKEGGLSLLEEDKTEDKVELIEREKKLKFFDSASEESRRSFTEIEKLLLEGDYKLAKEEALDFYNRVNSISFKGPELEKQMANIALGNVYRAYGDYYKWKFVHMTAYNFFKNARRTISQFDRTFGMIELQDLIIEVEDQDTAKREFDSAKKVISRNSLIFGQKLMNETYYKLNRAYYKLYYKSGNKESVFRYLEFAEERVKKVFTYYSLQEAHLLYDKAYFQYEMKGDMEGAFENYKQSYIVAKKLLDKIGKSDKSVFLADIYFSIGDLLAAGVKQKESVEYFEKSKEIYLQYGLHSKVIENELQLINSYKLSGMIKKADQEIAFALEYAKKNFGERSSEYADILIMKADILIGQKEFNKAMKLMNEAKSIYEERFGKYSKEVKMLNATFDYINLQIE